MGLEVRKNEKLIAANIKTCRNIIQELKQEDYTLNQGDADRLVKAEEMLQTGLSKAKGEIDYTYTLVKDNIALSLLVHTLRKDTLIHQVDEANPMMAFV